MVARHSTAAWLFLLLVTVAIGLAIYVSLFGRMFPLVEYRQWLTSGIELDHVLRNFLAWDSTMHRIVPLYAVVLIDGLCGGGVCSNVMLLLVLGLAAVCMGLALGVLARWRSPVAGAVAIGAMILSEPWLQNAVWQATALDKFGGLGVALATLIYALALRCDVRWRIVVGNTAVLLAIALAYNCKEATWGLVPSLLLLGWLTDREHGRVRAAWRSAASLALPCAYVAFLAVRMAVHRIGAPPDPHNFGGDPWTNLLTFARGLLNASVPSAALLGIVALTCAVALWLARRDRDLRLISIWSVASFVLTLAMPLRTLFAQPFYMLIPSLYLAGVVYVLIIAAAESRWRALALPAVAAALAFHLWLFAQRLPPYIEVAAQSDHFIRALPEIAAATRGHAEPVLVLYPRRNWAGFLFVDQGMVGRYVFDGDVAAAAAFDARFRHQTFNGVASEIPPDGSIRVIFDDRMRLEAIEGPSG